MQTTQLSTCPRCGNMYTGYPALSRLDNRTNICSPCGTDEALREYFNKPPRVWATCEHVYNSACPACGIEQEN